MVRTYKRVSNRHSWSIENMESAVQAVIKTKLDLLKAARQLRVPHSTLKRYVKKRKEDPWCPVVKKLGRYTCVFTVAQEEQLAQFLKNMEEEASGLTMIECRKLAYQLAVIHGCTHNFNSETEMAGEDWMHGFLKRHGNVIIRKS